MTSQDDPTALVRQADDYCRRAAEWEEAGSYRAAVECYTQAERLIKRADKARGVDYGPVSLDAKRRLLAIIRAA